jgi:nucleotide-binding universal stress UspA family protein
MVEFRQILCPVDFSENSVRARAYAAALARWYGAQLFVLHVVPTFEPMQVRGDLGEPVQIVTPMLREEVLADMRQSLGLAAPGATALAEAGDPRATIIDQALSKKVDLIVMGTHGRRGFTRLLLGSVTEGVLRQAPCPVLTVPPHASADVPEAVTFKRILCPIDFSPSSLQALGFALNLARQADGRVTLLHAVEWLAEEQPRALASTHFNVSEYRSHIESEAQERLRTLVAEESRTWVDIADVVVFGRAHREILRAAEARPADLIVMGAQGRGGIDLAVFGSTTQQVVRGATCPVLTVRGVPQT